MSAITLRTRLGALANGVPSHVPRFRLGDPSKEADEGYKPGACTPAPSAAGVPMFLSPHLEVRGNEDVKRPALAYESGSGTTWELVQSCALGLRRRVRAFLAPPPSPPEPRSLPSPRSAARSGRTHRFFVSSNSMSENALPGPGPAEGQAREGSCSPQPT